MPQNTIKKDTRMTVNAMGREPTTNPPLDHVQDSLKLLQRRLRSMHWLLSSVLLAATRVPEMK